MESDLIVILTGAGISAESGIETFRSANGLWENHPIEKVATPRAFKKNPHFVHNFYNERRQQLQNSLVKPNPAHKALAYLEKEYHGDTLIVTQNIDNLHERGGSQNIIHVHGEILKTRCVKTKKVFDSTVDLFPHSICQCCNKPGTLRPHIVWFGEMPLEIDRVYKALESALIFISIGTSGTVYPAAGFAKYAQSCGSRCIEVNPEPSYNACYEKIYLGPASVQVPQLVDDILSKKIT